MKFLTIPGSVLAQVINTAYSFRIIREIVSKEIITNLT